MDTLYIGTWKRNDTPSRLFIYKPNDSAVPASSCIQTIDLPGNMSFIKTDREKRLLYLLTNTDPEVNEGCGGVLSIYSAGEDGKLQIVQKVSTFGAEPIELSLQEDTIAVVNHGSTDNRVCRSYVKEDGTIGTEWVYDEASLVLLKGNEDGTAGDLLDLHKFIGHGDIPFFQETAAPHSIFGSKENGLLLIPERGSDRTSVFSIHDGRLCLEYTLPEKKGFGPRNAVLTKDGRHVYVVDEIMPSISHYCLPECTAAERISSVTKEAASLCDDDPRLFTSPHPVAIWLSQDEKFLYVLTRSTETMSVYSRDENSGKLSMIQEWKLGGTNPRQAMIEEDRLYIILMDTQNLSEVIVDTETGLAVGERTVLDGIDGIAAVEFL